MTTPRSTLGCKEEEQTDRQGNSGGSVVYRLWTGHNNYMSVV